MRGAAGNTVLGSAVSVFASAPEIDIIVIVVPDDPLQGEAAARKALPPELLDEKAHPVIQFVSGGSKRQDSVRYALSALEAEAPAYVLIHDGARPWVGCSLIRRVINAVKQYQAVVPLLPLAETPKETDIPFDGTNTVLIKNHLKRAFMGSAQTPQGFAFPAILAAHRKAATEYAQIEFTDDAEIWAACGGAESVPVAAIPGEPENRKITFPEDIREANCIFG